MKAKEIYLDVRYYPNEHGVEIIAYRKPIRELPTETITAIEPDKEYPELITNLMDIEGVDSVRLNKYSLDIYAGKAYQLDAVVDKCIYVLKQKLKTK